MTDEIDLDTAIMIVQDACFCDGFKAGWNEGQKDNGKSCLTKPLPKKYNKAISTIRNHHTTHQRALDALEVAREGFLSMRADIVGVKAARISVQALTQINQIIGGEDEPSY